MSDDNKTSVSENSLANPAKKKKRYYYHRKKKPAVKTETQPEKQAKKQPEKQAKKQPEKQAKKKPEKQIKKPKDNRADAIKFIYRAGDDVVHDMGCKIAARIPKQERMETDEYPRFKNQCPNCAAYAYVRLGAQDPARMQDYLRLYRYMQVPIDLLRYMYVDLGMKTSIYENTVTVKYKQDTWRIKALDNKGHVCLFHNNYTVEGDHRVFIKGFHVQSELTRSTNVTYAIKVIESYAWSMHRISAKYDKTEEPKLTLRERLRMRKLERAKKRLESSRRMVMELQGQVTPDAKKDFMIPLENFNMVKEKGFPRPASRCLYVYETKNGILQWSVGEYDAGNKRFVVKYGTEDFVTDASKVIAWRPVWEVKISSLDEERE